MRMATFGIIAEIGELKLHGGPHGHSVATMAMDIQESINRTLPTMVSLPSF